MIGGIYGFYNFLPFIIDIFVTNINRTSGNHHCAGSLIAYDWVLTAAHCVQMKPIERYYLGAGRKVNTFKITMHGHIKFDFGQTRRVGSIFYHKDYDRNLVLHDIALVKPLLPFKADHTLSPVSLPQKTEEDDLSQKYKYCYLGGWGQVGPNIVPVYNHKNKSWTYNNEYKTTKKLLHVVLPLISNKQCRRLYYRDVGFYFDPQDKQICTLYYPGRKSSCRGDSGGPLICGSKQYGITSWSYSCGSPRFGADVYTRVDKYLDWINRTMDAITNDINYKSKNQECNDYYDYESVDFKSARSTRNIALVFVLIFNYILVVLIM